MAVVEGDHVAVAAGSGPAVPARHPTPCRSRAAKPPLHHGSGAGRCRPAAGGTRRPPRVVRGRPGPGSVASWLLRHPAPGPLPQQDRASPPSEAGRLCAGWSARPSGSSPGAPAPIPRVTTGGRGAGSARTLIGPFRSTVGSANSVRATSLARVPRSSSPRRVPCRSLRRAQQEESEGHHQQRPGDRCAVGAPDTGGDGAKDHQPPARQRVAAAAFASSLPPKAAERRPARRGPGGSVGRQARKARQVPGS
jgi:hypothetical protein